MKVLLSGTIALLVLNSSARADWPQFRGPDGQGVSTARNVPLKWGLKEGVAWKKKLPGKGWSSPVIGANKVIMTVAREDGKKVTLGVVAVDVQSGEIAWNRDLFTPDAGEVRKRHSKNGLASATPYLEEGVVYA
ncbi:MAG: serine/threonine protein kinase, partial [Verrucomicrobiota bacterium]|nr:serine/threonine protein kinase [Verrucomicrobiota bacterium]